MSTIPRFLLVLTIALSVLGLSTPLRAQELQQAIYLPLLSTPGVSYEGEWQGALTQPGKLFDFSLSLTQNGTNLEGTATIHDNAYYATMQITGAIFGDTIVLDEEQIIDTSGPPPPSTRWCMKTLTLTPYEHSDSGLLNGTWKQDGCNSGKVYLQNSNIVAVVNGTWKGTFTQGGTTFSIEIALNQAARNLEGVATTRRADTAFGTMRVKGIVAGPFVVLQETELLSSSPNVGWCLKTIETTFEASTPKTLSGSWSALNCVQGTLRVQYVGQ